MNLFWKVSESRSISKLKYLLDFERLSLFYSNIECIMNLLTNFEDLLEVQGLNYTVFKYWRSCIMKFYSFESLENWLIYLILL